MDETTPALPEGADAIIEDAPIETGAGDDGTAAESKPQEHAGAAIEEARSTFASLKQAALDNTAELRAQAGDKVWSFADQGKARATTALESLAKMVNDAAGQVDEKVGPEYGAYARKAADAVSGAAESLQNKSLDEIVEDAKSLVRSSPAVAIGIAAALGFVVARLARSGAGAPDEDERA